MKPVTFTCKRSGNSVTFYREGDIAAMRKEPGYVEVEEQVLPALPDVETKTRGRPRKVRDYGSNGPTESNGSSSEG